MPRMANTSFREYKLFDSGAYPELPLSGKITWKVTQPSLEPKNDEERTQIEKLRSVMKHIRKASERKKHPTTETNMDSPQKEE